MDRAGNFIQNLLMTTAARTAALSDSESGDSDDNAYERDAHDIGSIDLVSRTLQGIAAHDEATEND